jgi:lipoate-protein ligase A
MKYIDLTLPSPEENLACDEALLDLCEEGWDGEILRFWEPRGHFVVVGYANKTAEEVNLTFCRENGIPVLRRCSGGGTVLQGPGCLNYSLILEITETGPLRSITEANTFILDRQRSALGALLDREVQILGHTDLAIGSVKFSGNAQRRKRKFLLFHGTFLVQFDISLIEKALRMPSRQPDYRHNRSHSEFLANLNLPPAVLKSALQKAWSAKTPLSNIPSEKIRELTRQKYATKEWNLKF